MLKINARNASNLLWLKRLSIVLNFFPENIYLGGIFIQFYQPWFIINSGLKGDVKFWYLKRIYLVDTDS